MKAMGKSASKCAGPVISTAFPMNRRLPKETRHGLPHARGGVSKMVDGGIVRKTSSPRMWGCFSGRTWNGFRVEGGKAGEGVKFELIRRITGYLVGTVERFNDAKQAEVMDRVKHTV